MKALFEDMPALPPDIEPNHACRLLYDAGDAAPVGSPERAKYYRMAAAIQAKEDRIDARKIEAARRAYDREQRRKEWSRRNVLA